MTERQAFHEMADAIYSLHSILKRMKQIYKFIKNPKEANREIKRECVENLKDASEKTKKFMDEWLSEMEKNLQS